jgi:hypothetical protein
MKRWMWIMAVSAAVLFAGCEESVLAPDVGTSEATKTNEVEKIVPTELQVMVGEYETAVNQKLAELEILKDKVQEIPIGEMVDEQTQVIKGALEEVTDSLGKMMDELVAELEEMVPEKK